MIRFRLSFVIDDAGSCGEGEAMGAIQIIRDLQKFVKDNEYYFYAILSLFFSFFPYDGSIVPVLVREAAKII